MHYSLSRLILLVTCSFKLSDQFFNVVHNGYKCKLNYVSSMRFESVLKGGSSISSVSNSNEIPNKGRTVSRKSSNGDMLRTMEKILAACKGHGTVSSITEVNHAITWAGRQGRIEEAILIFKSISTLGLKPDLMSYNNIIWGVGHAGRLDMSKRLFQELLKLKLKPNIYTYGALVHACAKSKNYKQALYYLDRIEEEGLRPNLVVFTSAMEACAECGQYQDALAVMKRMESTGIKPDLTMVNAAIKACCIGGAMDEAEAFANSLTAQGMWMDLFTYHTLMMGHTKLGRNQRVLGLYDEALSSGTKLDGGIYSLAMLAALNSGAHLTVPRIAAQARADRVPLTEASYTILMQAYGEVGAAEQAMTCLDDMLAEGLRPNVFSYAATMAACKDYPDKVLKVLKRSRESSVQPNTVMLTTAIDSLARAGGNFSEIAIGILRDMERNGPEPNLFTYNTVIRAFADGGRLEEALEVLSSIRGRGLQADRFTFTSLLLACGRTEDVCSEQVTLVMSKMKSAGVAPDEIAYGAAIDAYRRGGSPLKAVECLHEMHRMHLEPSVAHYNLVLRALKSKQMTDMMFKMVIGLAAKEGSKVNLNSFELALEALIEDERWRESLLLLRSMQKLQFQPSVKSCVLLVQLLEKKRQYRAALALYRLMVQDGVDFYENDLLNGIFKRLVQAVAGSVSADLVDTAASVVDQVPVRLLSSPSSSTKQAEAARARGLRESLLNSTVVGYANLMDLSNDLLEMQNM